jgi:acyl-CoA synthetase (AMP-forming)/AMP-acid ligase II
MTTHGLELDADDERPIIWRAPAETVTRGHLRKLSDELVDRLTRQSVRRAMVCSGDAVHILRALDACSRARIDLLVAHPDIGTAHLNRILDEFSIQFLIGSADEARDADAPQGDGSRLFLMTSGTTGNPKIAVQSLERILARLRPAAALADNRCARWLATYPHSAFAGLQVMLSACLSGSMIVESAARTISGFYESACRGGVTHISATPTFWRSFLTVHEPGELALRHVILGGEKVDQSILDALVAAFPEAKIVHTYASTEAGLVYSVSDKQAGFPSVWLEQPGNATQMRVRDGRLEVGLPGLPFDLATRSRLSFAEDGWLRTNDRCEIRGARAYIVAREDSAINVAGSKIYPEVIESLLGSLPSVADARCFAVPNPISGFLVGVDIQLAHGQEREAARADIMSACQRLLARAEVPRIVNIVDSMPAGRFGKKAR